MALMLLMILVLPYKAEAAARLCINEFFCEGASNFPDWIEIYNGGDEAASLQGYFLSDDLDYPRWEIKPNFVLGPGEMRVFVCDKKDSYDHTNFRLSSGGGDVCLFAPDGTLVDFLTYAKTKRLHSIGRYPDGGESWFYFDEPSYGRPNGGIRTPFGLESQTVAAPALNLEAGRYDKAVELRLAGGEREEVHFTRDGSTPTLKSPLFPKHLKLDETTVLRLRRIRPDGTQSAVASYSYVMNPQTDLAIVSLISDPENLWNAETGILVNGEGFESGKSLRPNWSYNWRRPVHVDFFESPERGKKGFSVDGEFRVYGGASRKRVQKSMSFYMGTKENPYPIVHQLYPREPQLTHFSGFGLRNGGDWWLKNQVIDGIGHSLAAGQMKTGRMAYRPVRVYLNGNYWGLMGLRNRFNRRNVLREHGLPLQKIDDIENTQISRDKNGPWKGVTEQFRNTGSYKQALVHWDIESYLDYLCLELFVNNTDWVGNNIKAWRPRVDDRKWRWFAYDLDYGLSGKRSPDFDTLAWLKGYPWRQNLRLGMLSTDPEFVRDFVTRMNAHMLTTFTVERMLEITDSIVDQITPEMPLHIARWKWKRPRMNMERWKDSIDPIRDFCRKRPKAMYGLLQKHFGYGPSVETEVHIGAVSGGHVELSGVPVPTEEIKGGVLKGITLTLRAVPQKGYRFVRWEGGENSPAQNQFIQAGMHTALHPVFEKKMNKE